MIRVTAGDDSFYIHIHTYCFIKTMAERIEFTLNENVNKTVNLSINQSINQSISQWIITTEITQNTSLGNVIWVKEHAINKIPIIMSVRKFKIMRSRAKTVTMISFYRAMHFSAYARSWDRMSSVRLSVCDVGGLWSHRLEILETNCTDN